MQYELDYIFNLRKARHAPADFSPATLLTIPSHFGKVDYHINMLLYIIKPLFF
jgi:hypothetical protein